jgi:hypothetical protein
MRSRRTTFLLIPAAVALCCAASAATATGTVRGRISDEKGGAMYHAFVLFHSDQAGQDQPVVRPDVTREGDTKGRFEGQL